MGKRKKKRSDRKQEPVETVSKIRRVSNVFSRDKIITHVKETAKWKMAAACLLIFAAAFLVYSNTLQNEFVWDDEYLIQNNSQIKSFSHLPDIFRTYIGYGSENINNFYRPVQEFSNMVDFHFWGLNPFGFHLTSVVLHSLVCVMVCVFFFFLSGSILVATVGGIFYAVHPIHTQAVAYVAGRADPLYVLFSLLSMLLFISYADNPFKARSIYKYVLSLLFFILALLSKELALVLPFLAAIYVFFFMRGTVNYSRLKWSLAPFAALAGVYVHLRMTILDFSSMAPVTGLSRVPILLRLLTFFRSILVYIGLLFFPRGLRLERTISVSSSIGPSELIAILLMALAVAAIWYLYKRDRVASFALLWFFVVLVPVSNIVPINSFIAEHWIYMASMGIFLLLGLAAQELWKKISSKEARARAVLTVLFALPLSGAVLIFSLLTVQRNKDWRDPITFFESTLKYSPRNTRLYLNMGNAYFRKKDLASAIDCYNKAVEIDPNYAVAYGNIGSVYLNQGNTAKAEENFLKAVSIADRFPIVRYNLGIIYDGQRKYDDAIRELRKATEQLPQFYQAWNLLGRVYLKKKDPLSASQAFKRSISILPDQPQIEAILSKIGKY